MKAPTRLRDDPALAPELRTDLERAATTTPAYDVAAGLAALQAGIAVSSAASASSAAAAHASAAPATSAAASSTAATSTAATATGAGHGAGLLAALSTKAVLATVLGAAAVAVTAIAWPSQPSTRPAPAVAAHGAPHAPQAPQAQPKPEAPTVQPALAPTAIPEAPVAPAPVRPAMPVADAPRTAATDATKADPRREIAQLARIKALVETDPARAYLLAQRGDREFARGMLRQEREALAIIALANSGRRAQAERRMSAFLDRYPNSPARERLERVLSGGTATSE